MAYLYVLTPQHAERRPGDRLGPKAGRYEALRQEIESLKGEVGSSEPGNGAES